MSAKEYKRRKISSAALKQAWLLLRRTNAYSWPEILRLSWSIVRSRSMIHYSKISGVTAKGTNRQSILRMLSKCGNGKITLSLVHEPNNDNDPNALRIVMLCGSDTSYTLGYVKRELASGMLEFIRKGKKVMLFCERITGPRSLGLYGLNYAYSIL